MKQHENKPNRVLTDNLSICLMKWLNQKQVPTIYLFGGLIDFEGPKIEYKNLTS